MRWISIFLLASTLTVHAKDTGQWENTDPTVHEWFGKVMRPDTDGSCCGAGDAYWADKVRVDGSNVYAIITDTRNDEPLNRTHIPVGTEFLIPQIKYQWKYGNPTGHTVVFIAGGTVICFIPNGGV